MKLYSVYDEAFRNYGSVLEKYDTAPLLAAMEKFPLLVNATAYRPGIEQLEACEIFSELQTRAFGGMPIQLGMCWGRNTKLNCLEYHRDSEVNIGTDDFILLLAKREEIVNGELDTALVRAFLIPKGVPVEIYATTLHFAPCHVDEETGFRVAVVLPKGTNTPMPEFEPLSEEDTWMTARNKWLLAHPESRQGQAGAYIGLRGKNLDVATDLDADK